MKTIYCVATLSTVLACGISDKDRCSEGRVWSPQYKGCLDTEGVAGASSTGTGAGGDETASVAGAPAIGNGNLAGAAANGQTSSNLGATCRADTDCAGGVATSCLLNPQAPADPGMCTILDCDAAACGDAYDCCDCTKSSLLGSTWPEPKCVPTANAPTLTGLSCTCS